MSSVLALFTYLIYFGGKFCILHFGPVGKNLAFLASDAISMVEVLCPDLFL